jgi:glutamate/tyrosine decarboxylase-like PLP-dependent enzyme
MKNTTDNNDFRALFLGSNSENDTFYKELINRIVDDVTYFRKSYQSTEANTITESIKEEPNFRATKAHFLTELDQILRELKDSLPTWDIKHMAHMFGDVMLPAVAGKFAALLYNPNTVTSEVSTSTFNMERKYIADLCKMVGYPQYDMDSLELDNTKEQVSSWGHLTSGGTLANFNALWAARNLKYSIASIGLAYNNNFKDEKHNSNSMEIIENEEHISRLKEIIKNAFKKTELTNIIDTKGKVDVERLFNISPSVSIRAYKNILNGINEYAQNQNESDRKRLSKNLKDLLDKFEFRKIGIHKFHESTGITPPKLIISKTRHNTWDKIPDILGLGRDNLEFIDVDSHYRIDINKLKTKIKEFKEKKIPILAVVSVFGSTEEGACDALYEILKIRNENEDHSFYVHVDAAYGGYFSLLVDMEKYNQNTNQSDINKQINNVYEDIIKDLQNDIYIRNNNEYSINNNNVFPVGEYNNFIDAFLNNIEYNNKTDKPNFFVRNILALREADSIVMDPHKLNYVPYPAGAVIYRDGSIRNYTDFEAPYLEWSGTKKDEKHIFVGKSMLECSRPGSAAAACYLASRVMPLDSKHHGKIIRHTLISSFLFNRSIELFNKNKEINQGLFVALQYDVSDTNIYGFLFGIPDYVRKPEHVNKLNDRIIKGMTKFLNKYIFEYDYFLSKTKLGYNEYADRITEFLEKVNVSTEHIKDKDTFELTILRSVLMNPLISYQNDKHFMDFWIRQKDLAVNELPKILSELLREKNTSNKLNVLWIENETGPDVIKNKLEFDSIISSVVNIFYYHYYFRFITTITCNIIFFITTISGTKRNYIACY